MNHPREDNPNPCQFACLETVISESIETYTARHDLLQCLLVVSRTYLALSVTAGWAPISSRFDNGSFGVVNFAMSYFDQLQNS